MQLTVIGPAAAYTRRRGRASSSYLVELDGQAILLDLGQGSFAALGARMAPERLLGVFISHLHPDHHADLVPLRHYLMYALPTPSCIELHAPAALRARYDAYLGEPDFLACLPGGPLQSGKVSLGPFEVESARVTHMADSYGFRVGPAARPDAPGLVYSGDCGRPDDLLALLRPGDTLLCEASWGTGEAIPSVEHLTAWQAADVARRGGAAQLIVTHVLDEFAGGTGRVARATFGGPTVLAKPGLRVVID